MIIHHKARCWTTRTNNFDRVTLNVSMLMLYLKQVKDIHNSKRKRVEWQPECFLNARSPKPFIQKVIVLMRGVKIYVTLCSLRTKSVSDGTNLVHFDPYHKLRYPTHPFATCKITFLLEFRRCNCHVYRVTKP